VKDALSFKSNRCITFIGFRRKDAIPQGYKRANFHGFVIMFDLQIFKSTFTLRYTLKDKNVDYQIRWRIVRHARSYSNVKKKCNLCLWEKYYIICRPNMATLNSRNELVSSCRHAKKFLLNSLII